jgi:hypothetical protein
MASTGDPSTFTFTMDAFPGYTLFDKTKKVLCVMQIANDTDEAEDKGYTVMDTHEHTATQTATDTSAQASLDEVVD